MGKDKKEPMYSPDPKDSSPIARRTFLVTVAVLALLAFALLIVVIMCLNGTIPPVNDRYYVRPVEIENQSEFDVVKPVSLQCRDDVAMDIKGVTLSPSPLSLPDNTYGYYYNMTLRADLPEEVAIKLLVQRLMPPWKTLPCMTVNGVMQGSCVYENACETVAKIFGKEKCEDMKAGHYEGTINGRTFDPVGELGWAQPGNYFIQAKVTFRDEMFGCVVMSFRVVEST